MSVRLSPFEQEVADLLRSVGSVDLQTEALEQRVLSATKRQDKEATPRRATWGFAAMASAAAVALIAALPVALHMVAGAPDSQPRQTGPGGDPSTIINVGSWSPGDPARHLRIAGTLAVTDAGCVYLQSESGDDFNLVWPAGWSAQATADGWAVTSPDGPFKLTPGDQLEAGGGYVDGEVQCRVSTEAKSLAIEGQPRLPKEN